MADGAAIAPASPPPTPTGVDFIKAQTTNAPPIIAPFLLMSQGRSNGGRCRRCSYQPAPHPYRGGYHQGAIDKCPAYYSPLQN